MIIKIDKSNQALYNDFFKKAYADAKDLRIDMPNEEGKVAFSSLWEYFQYLPDLAAQKPEYYTKLPLDEKMADIDGNSRKINIPLQLQTCAGIENDHMAESIMFLIDRYQDGQDLTNAQIWIQWKTEDGSAGDNVVVPHIDIDFQQNKIRFPWPLTSDVTSNPGNIEFSVVFFMKDENNSNDIVYRYSTLPSKIRIEPALRADLGANAVSVGPKFIKAVRKNDYGPGFYIPAKPYFEKEQNGVNLDRESNLDYTNPEHTEKGILTLKAQATITDTGTISYKWKHTPENGKVEFTCGENISLTLAAGTVLEADDVEFIKAYIEGSTTLEAGVLSSNTTINYSFGRVKEEYVELKKSDKKDFDVYYKKLSGNTYTPLTEDDMKELNDNDTIYEQLTTFELPEDGPVAGWYFVTATNTVTGNGETKTNQTDSTKTLLIGPENISFENTNQETIELQSGSDAVLNTLLIRKEHETYSGELFKGNNANDITTNFGKSLQEDNTFSTDATGWYQGKITVKRNRKDDTENTKIWRVVNPVTTPTLKSQTVMGDPIINITKTEPTILDGKSFPTYYVDIDSSAYSLDTGFELSVAVEEGESTLDIGEYYENPGFETSLISDTYKIEWYKNVPDQKEKQYSDVTTASITIKEKLDDNMVIYCKLTNTLNNKESSTYIFFKIT